VVLGDVPWASRERSDAMAEELRPAGYEVHRTPDARNAPSIVRRLRSDLVVVALNLPWLDAVDGGESLRCPRRSCATPPTAMPR
jgi:DNA-binding response OmpR family regulator